jgi:hypothetical protein
LATPVGPYSRTISAADRFMLRLITWGGFHPCQSVWSGEQGRRGSGTGGHPAAARPRPNDCTLLLPQAGRGPLHGALATSSASARAEPTDSPSVKASTAPCCSSTGCARTTTRVRRRHQHKPRFVAPRRPAFEARAKPPDFDPQPRAMRFIDELRPNARARSRSSTRATPRPMRVRAQQHRRLAARPLCARHARHNGTRPR